MSKRTKAKIRRNQKKSQRSDMAFFGESIKDHRIAPQKQLKLMSKSGLRPKKA